MYKDAIVRFFAKTEWRSGCLVWTGRCNVRTGRAIFRQAGKQYPAARWLWQERFGTLAPGLCVLHKCDNVKCVSLDHLFIGTQAENIRDRDAKGRNRLAHKRCVRGHDLANPDNVTLYANGRWRRCKICARIRQAAFRAKRAKV